MSEPRLMERVRNPIRMLGLRIQPDTRLPVFSRGTKCR
jgi:hypothetical protein